jgi:VanZ family protein
MTLLLRLIAWALAAAVAFASLGPPSYRPHADIGQNGEHALAFVLVGFAFALAYPRKRLAGALLAPVAIGALELLQMWAPGRHARLSDFVVDLLATWAGLAIAVARDWLLQRYRKVPT